MTEHGRRDLVDYVETNWDYIALLDDNGSEVLRLSTSDSRVQFTHATDATEAILEITVSGGDSEFSLPQTFAESEIYKTSSATNPMRSKAFSNPTSQTLENTSDELTVEHKVPFTDA